MAENIQEILKQSIDPLKVSLLFNSNEYQDFLCFHSSSSIYEVGKEYNLYDLKGLLRVLCLKRAILNEELLKNLYKRNLDEICLILEWNDHARKIMLIQTADLNHFDEELFANTFNKEVNSLLKEFQKTYFNYKGEA
ncbi:MAG: hypothetical protein HN509_00490 [Halobacteriovoraceae bacterium]|jgi:hypothetical protein|nr:hypothetical protein [Halobacteriovoraceae bacterium]MBT5094008.1 hypothetical protein [Halobacteriovoraceae bacterium]